mmetsp:Transcript_24687/g.54159  ORF Transcript_24687/g.54159 Transcript_24687/m.54159 type:complete len:97 (-) Transcript_24687:104-394(-)
MGRCTKDKKQETLLTNQPLQTRRDPLRFLIPIHDGAGTVKFTYIGITYDQTDEEVGLLQIITLYYLHFVFNRIESNNNVLLSKYISSAQYSSRTNS